MNAKPVALIVDIVRSRELDNRRAAQEAIRDAFAVPHATLPTLQPLVPTVGDEFQAVFADIAGALRATAIARLSFPAGVDCRFGLGRGDIRHIEPGAAGSIQDGSAWWCAREAIEEAHRREDGGNPYLRTWFVSDDDSTAGDALINAYLLMRDQAISSMQSRERRLAAGALLGRPQADLARDEGITQSAVSQNLRRSGAAGLLAANRVLEEASR